MVKTVSSSEARANLGNVLNGVYYTKEPVAVQKKGKTVAVIVSPEAFARLQEEDARDWALIASVAAGNDAVDPDVVLADVTAEVEAARRERYVG